MSGKAVGLEPELSWSHISVCSCLPLAGEKLPHGMVVPAAQRVPAEQLPTTRRRIAIRAWKLWLGDMRWHARARHRPADG